LISAANGYFLLIASALALLVIRRIQQIPVSAAPFLRQAFEFPGTIPLVESVTCFGEFQSSRIEYDAHRRIPLEIEQGLPLPISQMFVCGASPDFVRGFSPHLCFRFAALVRFFEWQQTCARISPAVRFSYQTELRVRQKCNLQHILPAGMQISAFPRRHEHRSTEAGRAISSLPGSPNK